MPRQGLTAETVTVAATLLAEEIGCENLTLHKLANRLNIKPASLYTHISGIEQLYVLLSDLALRQLGNAMRMTDLKFAGAEGGLVDCEGKEDLMKWQARMGLFFPAKMRVQDDMIEIWNPEVSNPAYVRYAFVNYGKVSLFDKAGFPVMPFRAKVCL